MAAKKHVALRLGERVYEEWKRRLPKRSGALNSANGRSWLEVASAAQAFAAGAWLREWEKEGVRTVIVVCEGVRRQEELADELEMWCPGGRSFPELLVGAGEDVLPDPETAAERLEILEALGGAKPPRWLCVSRSQLGELVPVPEEIAHGVFRVTPGMRLDPDELVARLEGWGYEGVPQVYQRGQYARRGGIVDVFSWQSMRPGRVEFFDVEVESLREFDLERQISVGGIMELRVLATGREEGRVSLGELVGDLRWIEVEPAGEEPSGGWVIREGLAAEGDASAGPVLCGWSEARFGAGDFILDEAKREAFFLRLREWVAGDWRVVFVCGNEGEGVRFAELLGEQGIGEDWFWVGEGTQTESFVCEAARLAVLTDADVFGRSGSRRMERLARRRGGVLAGRAVEDFSVFEEGDRVVHVEHGIGRYEGVREMDGEEVLCVGFAGDARLYVPVDQAWKVSRYVGLGQKRPVLSELGSGKWEQAKSKTTRAVFEYARRMLQMQAERETASGFSFPSDSHWQEEFEKAFPFQETRDQLTAIASVKADMENIRPMDRLICGDVGFGKTEVAIRAAFKAVMGGKQVAFLAPTTVLAQQHFQTLRERMSDYPVRIEMLSRYRTRREQNATLAGVAEGAVDIVVGTHRLVSPDVRWKDLGLLIVDEEQRFGVRHKDLIKERFRLVDVLTLSATPIPRTLYLALMGARDMSVIETPPPNRQPVQTIVAAYDERILRDAVERELARGGQVYLLHNRVRTIDRLAGRVRELVPRARVVVGHGQMEEGELEEVMREFVEGRADVLVSTTIIESGLDIPNANTILIDRADMFGLADLYQLRGRVGRSGVKACAYLLMPRSLLTVGEARKRISAIKQYSQLGAGFKIAMRDLEIRGAGNILGTAQSGHIITVGFDLYCKMLRQAVRKLQGEGEADRRAAVVRLDFVCREEMRWSEEMAGELAPVFLPRAYVSDPGQRVDAHRRLHEAGREEELDALEAEWRDRFGPLPAEAAHCLLLARIALAAGQSRISRVEVKDDRLMLTRRGDFILLGNKFPRLAAEDPVEKLKEVWRKVSGL